MARTTRIGARFPPAARVLGIAALAAVFILLCLLQFVSSALLRNYAAPFSLVRLVPDRVADWMLEHDRVRAPTSTLRLLLARQAVARGDDALAASRIARLPPGRDRAQLEANLAEARGDHAAAIRGYLEAGDLVSLEHEEARVAASGNTHAAVVLQRQIVKALEADPTQPDALAEAWWQLGLAEQLDGYMHYPISGRRPWALRAMHAYEHAVALAPLSERYLIAAGSQKVNLNDDAAAEVYFERARDVDPTSAQAWVGLAEIALRRGDRSAANRYWQRARRLDGSLPAAQRLGVKLQQ